MTRAIDPKGLSRSKPSGHPNQWPIADFNAFVTLVRAAAEREEDHAVDRVIEAGVALGLPPRHWVIQEVLIGVHNQFPLNGGWSYADGAETFLRVAGIEDLRDRETWEWAMTAAGRSLQ